MWSSGRGQPPSAELAFWWRTWCFAAASLWVRRCCRAPSAAAGFGFYRRDSSGNRWPTWGQFSTCTEEVLHAVKASSVMPSYLTVQAPPCCLIPNCGDLSAAHHNPGFESCSWHCIPCPRQVLRDTSHACPPQLSHSRSTLCCQSQPECWAIYSAPDKINIQGMSHI